MKQMALRLPSELHAELMEWAKRENRSLHAQVLTILQQAVETDKAAVRSEHL